MRSDWQINLADATARHRSGMLLRATPNSAGYEVRPDPSTVPAPGPGMSAADISVLHQEIGRRVTEGGQLLVTALATQRNR